MGKIKVSNGTDTYEIDGNDLPSAVKDGFKPTERIIVTNSKTQETYEIDPNDVKSAMDDGFTFKDAVKKNGKFGSTSQPEISEPTFKSAPVQTPTREFKNAPPKEDIHFDHEKNTIQANNRIRTHLQNIDESVHNLIYDYKKDILGRQKSEQLAINKPFEAAPINPQAQILENKSRQDVQVNPDEVNQFKADMNTNPAMMRQGLEQKAKDLSKTDAKSANQLKADVYRVDAQNRPDKEKKISENAEKINNGEFDYDIKRGILTKPEGFFGSLVMGYKQKVDAYKDYDLYKTGDEVAILKNLNKKLEQDPDEATPMPSGTSGEAGQMLGGQPLKPIIAGGVAGYFGGPEAGTAAMSAVSAPEMYKLSFAQGLPQNYAAIKKQHPDISDHDALQQAIDLSHKQANIDAATGAAMGALGGKLAFKPTNLNGLLGKPILNAMTQIGQAGVKKTLEGMGVGALGVPGQVIKNIMAEKAGIPTDESEGVLDQIKGGALMTIGTHLAAKLPELIKPSTYNKIIHGLSKAPEESINEHLNNLQQVGEITPEEAQKTKEAIQEQKNLDQSIKPDISDADKVKIKQKIKQRNALENEMETSDKAFHPETKEKIKKINDDIVNISNGSERSELQKLVDKSPIKGSTKEYLQSLDEKELNDAFKEIASQAHDPLSENQAIQTFGEDIVNKSKELYPKEESKTEIISEHKPISENIQPNKEYKTMNMGNDEGKDETPEARKQMKARMLDGDIPMDGEGGKGETGKQFAGRVLSAWENTKNNEANNTALVTHSSVLKAIKTWENPETWKGIEKPADPSKMNDEQWKQYAENFNKESTDNGDLETFKGAKGDIHVIRHGQTEDNKMNKFRSGNTNLTEKGIQQAHDVGKELREKTNGDVPKIISSDLPRAIHTSNIIHENLKSTENASTIRSNQGQVQETGNAAEGSQNKSGENIQLPAEQTPVDAEIKQQAGQGEINNVDDFENELKKVFKPESKTEEEPKKTEPPKKKKEPAPKKEKPILSKKDQEMADYAYKNSYPYFKKEYPGIDVDEYNRLRSIKRQQGLPKLGEINEENNTRPRNEDTTQYTPKSIIEKAKAFYKNDPLINKVISFLEPIIKSNSNIKIDTNFKWDSNEYEGQKITNQALGYSFPSGNILLNFDRIGDYDTLYRTALHELMHAATRNEINKNSAFSGDLKKVLGDIRKAMGLPEGDSVVDALIRNKVISEDYDTRYGAANEHELLAEVFTNQKFFDYLKGLEYKGDNMLHRVFLAIAQFFSNKYKSLVEAKSKINSENIADYLQQLTEIVISDQQQLNKEGEALPALKGIKSEEEREQYKSEYKKELEKSLEDLRERYSDLNKSEKSFKKISEEKPTSIKNFINRITEGTTEDDVIKKKAYLSDQKKIQREQKKELREGLPRERGSNWIIEKLSKAARNKEITQDAANLGIDLVRSNPEVFSDLAISITKKTKDTNVEGFYRSADAIVKIFKGSDDLTAVHELLHHTERFMPDEIRDNIIKEWYNQIQIQKKELQKSIRKEIDPNKRFKQTTALLYLGLAEERQIESNYFNQQDIENIMHKYLNEQLGNSFYQLFNPSEWWAVNASELFQKMKNKPENNTWLQKAKNWYNQLIKTVKNVFGLNHLKQVEKGLNTILNGETLEIGRGAQLSASKKLLNIRQSESDILKNIIQKAQGKISDDDIRSKLKQIAGLNDQEIDKLISEVKPKVQPAQPARTLTQQEIGQTPEAPKQKGAFGKFMGKYFDRAKGLPDWILRLKDRAKGNVHVEVRQALQLVDQTREIAKKIGFDDWAQFDKALRGQYYGSDLADLKALPPEMQVQAVQMRNKIDSLSRDLIINNYVTPEQALNIESNIGEYMTRSYRAFNEKDWGKKVPQQAKDDAYRFLVQQKFNELLDPNDPNQDQNQLIEQAKTEAFRDLQSIIDGINDKYTPTKVSVEKGKDLGILMQRKDVPKEIRELLGEYTDPGVNFAMTVSRIASLKSTAEYLTSVKNQGLGEIFFEADNRPPEASVPIASEESETWNPLNGLYTTPEIKEIFKDSEATRNKWVQRWLKVVGAIKWSKTVGSVVTQVKNFESNLGFAVMNGHYRAGKSGESFKFLKDKLFTGEKSQDQMIEKVIRLGIVDQSVGVRELKDMFATDKLDKVIVDSSIKEKTPLKKIGSLLGKPIKYLNKVYAASDDFWKVYGFLNEAESLSNATYDTSYKNLTEDQKNTIDNEASERIKNIYPTYDRVWEGAKTVSKGLPIFGNFLSFQAESLRILLNSFNYAIQDLKTPNRKLIGAQRLAGIGAYLGARSMILYTIAQMTGVGMAGLLGLGNDDDKDQKLKDVNRYSPDFIRSGDKLALDHGEGNYTVYDVGGLDPYSIWFKTMNAYTEGNEMFPEGGWGASTTELLSPFLEPEMSFKIGLDLYKNENDFGGRIWNPLDNTGQQALDAMGYVLKKAKPSTIDFIQRVYSREDKQNEISAAFGGRGYKVDIPKSFSFKLKAAESLFDANRDALNKVKFNPESTEEEKNEAQKTFDERTNRIIKMLSEDYHAGIRLGAPMNKLDEEIDRKKFFQGYNKDVKNQIKSGLIEQESQSNSDEIKEWKP